MHRNICSRIVTSISQNLQPRVPLPKYYSDSSTAASKSESQQGVSGDSKGTKFVKNAPIRKAKTPIGKLDELEEGKHPYQEKEPLPPFPNNTNPVTGEIGGPRGPEPTRYGDWERKGRVTDF